MTPNHVLFVDGGGASVDVLADALARVGVRVVRARALDEAVRILLDETPDLVVVDLKMPGMNAWRFLREKSRTPDVARIPTILMEPPVTDGAPLDARAAGVIGHVDARATADTLLRLAEAGQQRRATDGQLLRAWYRSDLAAELGDALEDVLDLESMLRRVARLMVPGFAEWCVIRTRPQSAADTATVVRVHHDAGKESLLAHVVLDPMLDALSDGQMRAVRVDGEPQLSKLVSSREDQAILRRIGVSSLLVMPLYSRGTLLGVIGFGRNPGDYDDVDVTLAEEVAHRLATSVDISVSHTLAQRAARAREELLAIVSHDLRIPLTTISMVATKVKRAAGANDGTRRDAETILRNLRRMERLIRDLLDSSRLETGRLRVELGRCNIGQLLVQAAETARPLMGKRTLRVEAPGPNESPWVHGDRERVLQILDNLIGNALKFTPEGGTLTLKLDVRGGDVRVVVSDTGCGIAPEHLPHLFDRYWQVRSGDPYDARRGVGLGLFITKGLVEAQGGVVGVDSRVGEGTDFWFTLPLDVSEAATSSRGVRPILVIDDDLALRREIGDLLRREGYEVVAFAHGRAALEYLREHAPPALILTDLMMPVMDGWELTNALDADPDLSSVPVVVLSGAEADVSAPILRRCSLRLKKPASPDAILHAVAEQCSPFPASGSRPVATGANGANGASAAKSGNAANDR